VLDLLDLLLKVAPQTSQGEDNIFLDFSGLAGLDDGILVVAPEELKSIIDTTRFEKAGRG
jgi:hypothetical protein